MKIFILPAIVLCIDQLTKLWVKANYTLYVPTNIIGHYVRITFCENSGIAFGIQVGSFHILITFISYIITLLIIIHLYKEREKHILLTSSLGLILGGALGNMYDRTMMLIDPNNYSGVIDFIDIGLMQQRYRWYIFNIADSSITCGIIVYLIYSYLIENKKIHYNIK